MDQSLIPPELVEFITCSNCHLPFNEHDAVPKLLKCRHYFCIKCIKHLLITGKTAELYCVLCWKKTELPDTHAESLPTQNAIIYLLQNMQTLSNGSNSHSTEEHAWQYSNTGLAAATIDTITALKQERSLSLTSTTTQSASSTLGAFSTASDSSWNLKQLLGAGAADIGDDSTNVRFGTLNNLLALNANNSGQSNYREQNDFPDRQRVSENCLTHAMPNTHWCCNCHIVLCRACAAADIHRTHNVQNESAAKEHLHKAITTEFHLLQTIFQDFQQVVLQERDFLLKLLETCTNLKELIEHELAGQIQAMDFAEMSEILGQSQLCLDMIPKQSPAECVKFYTVLYGERQRFVAKYQHMFLQYKFDEWIGSCEVIFSFDMIKQTLTKMHQMWSDGEALTGLKLLTAAVPPDSEVGVGKAHPMLLLANYCISQIYMQNLLIAGTIQLERAAQKLVKPTSLAFDTHDDHAQQMRAPLSSNDNAKLIVATNNPNPNSLEHATYAQALQQNIATGTANVTATAAVKINRNLEHVFGQVTATISKSTTRIDQKPPTTTVIPIGQERARRQQLNQQRLEQQRVQENLHTLAHNLHQLQRIKASEAFIEQQQQQFQRLKANLLKNPSVHIYPILFFDLNMNGQHQGRVLIEVHHDLAPLMSKNFCALTTHKYGFGYKGCHVFQCWDDESIITGDFETNNGRGGRSIFNSAYFVPEETKIMAVRGTVGMRRSQRRHVNFGLVGSQFRIVLREMRGFTAMFAFVVEGLEFVDKVANTGDTSGKPHSHIVIMNCGEYKIGD